MRHIIFIVYIIILICFIPISLENSGQFGDSFGAINALFTGLGFAGLLTTIILQQRQIQQNQKENNKNNIESGIRNYESILFKLLELYQESLNEIIQTDGKNVIRGRDALRHSCDHVNKKISAENGNQLSPQALNNYEKSKLNEKNKNELNNLFHKNLYHLNFSFNRQGRYISALNSLLHHLEHSGPKEVNRDEYRGIILSQITAIESQYIFLFCLGVENDGGLRSLAISSGLVNKFSFVKKSKIQKIIYKEIRNHEIKNIRGNTHEIPKDFYQIKPQRIK